MGVHLTRILERRCATRDRGRSSEIQEDGEQCALNVLVGQKSLMHLCVGPLKNDYDNMSRHLSLLLNHFFPL